MTDRLEIIPILPGTGLEPEEAPARHVQSTELNVNLSGPNLPEVETRHGRPALRFEGATRVGSLPVPITAEFSAGEVASLWRRRCLHCAHFRQEIANSTFSLWDRAPDETSRKQAFVAMVRQYAHASAKDGEPTEIEIAIARRDLLNSWGICTALTEDRKDAVFVHPSACCPDGIEYFQPKGSAERKESSSLFDAIMRRAQGKV